FWIAHLAVVGGLRIATCTLVRATLPISIVRRDLNLALSGKGWVRSVEADRLYLLDLKRDQLRLLNLFGGPLCSHQSLSYQRRPGPERFVTHLFDAKLGLVQHRSAAVGERHPFLECCHSLLQSKTSFA